ncbi:MAG TPA: NAD(P)H-hydrate epimerase, partial [Desulfuromonadaceae bacterium]
MKLVSGHTMQELDRRTIDELGVPGLTLMENAGAACADEIVSQFGGTGKRALVVAGKGNNGGDGYVIARLLARKGWEVRVCVLADAGQIGGDAAANLALLPPDMVRFCPREGEVAALLGEEMPRTDVIVDALLGTGLNSEVGGVYREAIDLINGSGRPVVAVDIPSGIQAATGRVLGCAVTAGTTVTFACAKLGHAFHPGAGHTGRLVVADIGIPAELVASAPGCDFLDAEAVRPLVRRRDRQAHKGLFGHCLIVAGSTGKTGAAALSANSAVRAGSGLVTLAVPETLNPILEVKTTEAMTVPVPDAGRGYLGAAALPAIEPLLGGRRSVAIGPGIGRHPETVALVQSLVEAAEIPLVVDADGLNALAEDITVLNRTRSPSLVLT